MGEIRPFEEADIGPVADLELRVFHHRNQPAKEDLKDYIGEIFLRNPWRDNELNSLVYEDAGEVVGFLGVFPRRMSFCNRSIRVAVACQFMVDPGYRGLAGLELSRQFLHGPQDLTFIDGATEAVSSLWVGCHVTQLFSLEWFRALRPLRHLGNRMQEKAGFWGAAGKMARVLSRPADLLISRLPVGGLAAPRPGLPVEIAAPERLLACMQEVGWRESLRPDYEISSFEWLLKQAASAQRRGALRTAVVCDEKQRAVGWFIYYVRPGGVAQVLQIGARERQADGVFQSLVHDAWVQGACAIAGQVVPKFLANFGRQHCQFRYVSSGVLVHSRDSKLLSCIFKGDAALTRLDGEWWMRFLATNWL
jgi:hypothetical protein